MRAGVVGLAGVTQVDIHTGHEGSLRILGNLLGDVHGQVVLALGVDDLDALCLAHEHTTVAHLTTHLCIEGSLVEHYLIECLLLLCHTAIAQDAALILGVVPTDKGTVAGLNLHPVIILHGSGIACALLLLLHLGIESVLIHGESVLLADKLGEVEGETVGIEEGECLLA